MVIDLDHVERGERSKTLSLVSPFPIVNPSHRFYLSVFRWPTAPLAAVGLLPLSSVVLFIAFTLCYYLLVSLLCSTTSEARRVGDGLGSPESTLSRRLRSDLGQILIRVPPEALTHRCRPRLCSVGSSNRSILAVSFQGQPSTSTFLAERVKLSFAFRSPASRSFVLLMCFNSHSKASTRLLICKLAVSAASSVSRSGMRSQNDRLRLTVFFIFSGVSSGVSGAWSMPARSHFGEARSNSPESYSPALCLKPVEQEVLWYGSSKCCLCASL
ncbi:hypothetical protein Bca101_081745 [Brassica carinata]